MSRYLLESGAPDGYLLEDGSGVLLLDEELGPRRTGSASIVDGSATNGSTSVTVPADCNLVVAFWLGWDGAAGDTGMSSLELNNVPFTILTQVPTTDSISATGVAILENPSTGSQTFEWVWDSDFTPPLTFGGGIYLIYIKNANIGDAVRDSGAFQHDNTCTLQIDSEATDLVLAMGSSADTETILVGATLFIDNDTINDGQVDIGEVTAPSSPTSTFSLTGEIFGLLVAISLKQVVPDTSLLFSPIHFYLPLLVR